MSLEQSSTKTYSESFAFTGDDSSIIRNGNGFYFAEIDDGASNVIGGGTFLVAKTLGAAFVPIFVLDLGLFTAEFVFLSG